MSAPDITPRSMQALGPQQLASNSPVQTQAGSLSSLLRESSLSSEERELTLSLSSEQLEAVAIAPGRARASGPGGGAGGAPLAQHGARTGPSDGPCGSDAPVVAAQAKAWNAAMGGQISWRAFDVWARLFAANAAGVSLQTAQLAETMDCTDRHVRRLVGDLESAGLVARIYHAGSIFVAPTIPFSIASSCGPTVGAVAPESAAPPKQQTTQQAPKKQAPATRYDRHIEAPDLWHARIVQECGEEAPGASLSRSMARRLELLFSQHLPDELKPSAWKRVASARTPLVYLATLADPKGHLLPDVIAEKQKQKPQAPDLSQEARRTRDPEYSASRAPLSPPPSPLTSSEESAPAPATGASDAPCCVEPARKLNEPLSEEAKERFRDFFERLKDDLSDRPGEKKKERPSEYHPNRPAPLDACGALGVGTGDFVSRRKAQLTGGSIGRGFLSGEASSHF